MATIKSYSDLQQSKKLAEILPCESADMYYQYVLPKSDKIKHNPEIGNPINALEWYNKGYTLGGKEPIKLDEYCVSCWSLASLLGVLPKRIELEGVAYELSIYLNGLYYWNVNNGNLLLEVKGEDNLVDACVAMIEKLHELKML